MRLLKCLCCGYWSWGRQFIRQRNLDRLWTLKSPHRIVTSLSTSENFTLCFSNIFSSYVDLLILPSFVISKVNSKGVPRQGEVAQGVPGRLRRRIILTFRHYKGGRSSAKRTGSLYPRRNPWYSLSEAESNSGHIVLSGYHRKIPSDTTGNRSRDRPP